MRQVIDNILVVGHHNPDTDAAASAVAYAEFLNQVGRYDQDVVGAIPGELTPQAEYVFQRADKQKPLVVDNVSPRVGHVMTHKAQAMHKNQRVGEAIELLVRADMSMLPVLDESNELLGVFSHRSDTSRFLLGFDPTPMWGTLLTMDDLVAMPGMSVISMAEPRDLMGELRIALDGDRDWPTNLHEDDVLVCGDLHAIDRLDGNQLPGGVVVVNDGNLQASDQMARLNRAGAVVIQYEQSLAEFLRGLTMHIRLGALHLPTGPCVGELDRIEDLRGLLNDSRHAVPVLDDDGGFIGIVSRGDLDRQRCSRVILVDHFEQPQAVPGLESAQVLEILDHHRVGDIETGSPIRVQCRPVGSSCTIVAMNYFEENITIDPGTAVLLLGGIVADTLVLNGPTTTDIDRTIAPQLAEIAGVDLQEFGTDVLVAADDLVSADPRKIWNRDQKQFSIRNQNFAVAQLETASLDRLPDEKLDAFRDLVETDRQQNGRLLSLLVLTDVLKGDSWMFSSEADEVSGVIRATFSQDEPRPNWNAAPGVVSRKKQIVPAVMKALAT